MKCIELFRPSGTIDRSAYAVIGLAGFVIKHNLDRAVASMFDRPWGLFNYWVPVRDVARITSLQTQDAKFLATLLALALPFVWVGVVLTIKRLRSAQLPTWLVALFFVPFVNLLFFLVLCVVPHRDPGSAQPMRRAAALARIVPESKLGSAAVSLLLIVPIGIGLTVLGTVVFTDYGWGLFVAVPFTVGLGAAMIYGIREPRSLKSSVGVACAAVGLLGAAILGVALEGAFCLLMAMPLALALAAFGGVCGYLAQCRPNFSKDAPAFLGLALILAPGAQWMEHAVAAHPSSLMVSSAIDVQAPPEVVWKYVIAFSEIPEPREWYFRGGIAYPIRAEIKGKGPGAERHCIFSTGPFVEPIEIWDEPRRLKFSVSSNPEPLEEWSPYRHIEPAHLRGYLVSQAGQFLLTPLPDGGTRIEGTTWYRHGLWPSSYWRLWSDAIIHHIHLRVLRHIKQEAETAVSADPSLRTSRKQPM